MRSERSCPKPQPFHLLDSAPFPKTKRDAKRTSVLPYCISLFICGLFLFVRPSLLVNHLYGYLGRFHVFFPVPASVLFCVASPFYSVRGTWRMFSTLGDLFPRIFLRRVLFDVRSQCSSLDSQPVSVVGSQIVVADPGGVFFGCLLFR